MLSEAEESKEFVTWRNDIFDAERHHAAGVHERCIDRICRSKSQVNQRYDFGEFKEADPRCRD